MALYELQGRPVDIPTSKNFWVANNASVMGLVKLNEGSSIWFNAVLRGDNELIEIGENTNVQDGCILHTDMGYPLTIADHCTIGHMAVLHGCTIGKNSLIGIGATVMNGAEIGENCIIGAKALITEGKKIPDNSLVMGAPGKVVRDVTEEEVAGLTKSAIHYVSQWQRYKGGGFKQQH